MSGEITLRAGNAVRHTEWSNGGGDDAEFYAIELFGEAGEALNVVKKLERERLGMVGSRATVQDLADELADVVICLDLLALAHNMRPFMQSHDTADPALIWAMGLDNRSAKTLAVDLGGIIGNIMENSASPGDDPSCGIAQSLLWGLEDALQTTAILAVRYGIDLRAAIVAKFNKTSVKYGLTTMLAEDASIFG